MATQEEIDKVNLTVRRTFCEISWKELDKRNFINEIKSSPAFINRKKQFLSYFNDEEKEQIEKINILLNNNEFILDFLTTPPMFGNMRGRKFNEIVKKKVLSIESFKEEPYEINFEKKHTTFSTTEKPDFTIYNTQSKRVIIGMNQIDLWSGGQQLNRGAKYILENTNKNRDVLFLCVIASNEKCFFSKENCTSKKFKILQKGFDNDTLCYLKDLERIAKKWFEITPNETTSE